MDNNKVSMMEPKSQNQWDEASYAALMALRERVEGHIPVLAANIADSYAREFEDYARLLPEAQDQVVESVFLNLKALMVEIDPRAPLAQAFDRQALERIGAVRMRQGISFESLMRSFILWGQLAWTFFREKADRSDSSQFDALLHVSERIFWHVEQGSASMARGYMRESATSWTDREMTRYAVLEALVTGRIDDLQLANSDVAKNLASRYLAIVAVRRAAAPPQIRSLQDSVKEITKIVSPAVMGRPLIGSNAADIYVLWPDPVAGRHDAAIADVLDKLRQALPELAIGVGEPSADLSGVATSFAQAREAARIADALGSLTAMHHRDLRLERIIVRNDELRAFAHDVLEPIESYDRRKNSELMVTLRAFVESGNNVIETSSRLFVHANTVSYRLKRIAAISGHDPRSGPGSLALSLSLLAARLGGALRPERGND